MNLQNNNHVHVVTSWRSVALVLRASAEHDSAKRQSCTCCNFLEECCARAQGQVLNMNLQNNNHGQAEHDSAERQSCTCCNFLEECCARAQGQVLNMNLQNDNHVHVVTSWRSVALVLRASAEHESAERQSCTCCNFLEECCARAQGQVLNMNLQNNNHVHVVTSWRSVALVLRASAEHESAERQSCTCCTSWRSVALVLRASAEHESAEQQSLHVVTSWRSVALVLRASAEHDSAERQSCTCCNFLEECCARAQGQC
ncbi:hypothetical protein J6590_081341 [Homalodisca vitripennis]|nr:hypothetical protein J6590_081341 [Homalodisca vitripennis]